MNRRIAIIGAGYAGMAAAVELAQAGIAVEVFEAAAELGGRARAVHLRQATVDNGQHLLVGAYSETLRLLRLVDANQAQRLSPLLRLPLTLVYPGAMSLRAAALPAPLHLASALLLARGLGLADKWAALRFMRAMQARRFLLASDCSVAALLEAQRQTAPLRRLLWEPLCLAALNTLPEAASARVFLKVLGDTLGAARSASDLLLPRVDLGALFPDRAAAYLGARGGRVHRLTPVRAVVAADGGYTVIGKGGELGHYPQVIVAVAPWHASSLLAALPTLAALRQDLQALRSEPIVTCYLAYSAAVRLAQPMLGHCGGHLQWLFDRGQLAGPAGLLAAVISADGPHRRLDNRALIAAVHTEIAAMVAGLPPPQWSRVIREQRATFACTPDLARPPLRTALPGLLLAGDYVASEYPATLEAAVRSGVAAAVAARSGLQAAAGQT